MDMDLDIGWCLTCAKRTHDQRSPYCSEQCRQAETNPSSPTADPQAITSPLPAKFLPLPPTEGAARPSLRSASKTNDGLGVAPLSPITTGQLRSRRALSFPTSEEDDQPVLPSFTRKPKAVNAPSRSVKRGNGFTSPGGLLLTGASTPNESAICSTSDSEKDDTFKSSRRPPLSPLASCSSLHPLPPRPMTRASEAMPLSEATSLSSQLHTARPSLEIRPSTTARMATSSSRSREDIISWARGVELRDENGTIRHPRRGRRPEALANLTPPSTEPLDEAPHQSTTPRGTGALNAINRTFAPVVNALLSVSLVSSAPVQSPSVLGLQTDPAPAEVSRIDVMVGTRPGDELPMGTPTLSTISFSEAVDTSNATDMGETIETYTDDYSVVSSQRRSSLSPRTAPPPLTPQRVEPNRLKSSIPSRPSLQSTASAIWSLSSYLRSLTPFAAPFSLAMAVSPAVTPKKSPGTPNVPLDSAAMSPELVTPTLGLDIGATPAPVPTSRPEEVEVDPAHNLVRSVPLNIVVTAGSKAHAITEERAREREVIEYLGPQSRSCSRARAAAGISRRPSLPRQPSSESNHSDEDRGRGRRRTRRRDSRESAPRDGPSGSEDQRGRRRDRVGESRDRSWSACRGRPSRPSVRA